MVKCCRAALRSSSLKWVPQTMKTALATLYDALQRPQRVLLSVSRTACLSTEIGAYSITEHDQQFMLRRTLMTTTSPIALSGHSSQMQRRFGLSQIIKFLQCRECRLSQDVIQKAIQPVIGQRSEFVDFKRSRQCKFPAFQGFLSLRTRRTECWLRIS